jgi:hypothetical protein
MIIYRKKADGVSEYLSIIKINKIIFHYEFFINVLEICFHFCSTTGYNSAFDIQTLNRSFSRLFNLTHIKKKP